MLKKLLFGICVCFVALLVSCKGDDGAVGPAGAKGDTGATGATGAAGQNGGAAFIFTTGAVSGTGVDGDLTFGILGDLTAAEQAEYDSSIVVMIYTKSLGVWWPLPGVVQFTGSKLSNFTFVHGIQDATLFVDIFTTGWSEDQDAAPSRSFDDIRVVLIPGASSGKLSAEVNWQSYDETIKALGLTDSDVKKAVLFKKN